MEKKDSWMRTIVDPIKKDFRQKELIPVKILFFVHMSTILVLYPYFTIHMRELGISVEETAIMSALTPVVGILLPPLAGLIADKIGNFKIMLTFFSVCSGLSALLLLLIPIGRIRVTYPPDIVLGVTCTENSPMLFSLHEDYPCTMRTAAEEDFATRVRMQSCGFVCHAYLNEFDSDAVMRADHYDLQLHKVHENRTTSVRFTMPPGQPAPFKLKSDDEFTNHESLRNNERYATDIRKLYENSYFFPSANLFNISCILSDAGGLHEAALYNESNIEHNFDLPESAYKCKYSTSGPNVPNSFPVTLVPLNRTDEDTLEKRINYAALSMDLRHGSNQATCSAGYAQNKDFISVRLALTQENSTQVYKNIDLGSCASRCIATGLRKDFCSNDKRIIERDIDFTFWTYLSVRVFIGIISGTAYTMFEGAVIAILREYKADYGLQRIYAQLGGMISSPLSGLLIDYASRGKAYTDFKPIFFLYCGLKVTSALLMFFINLEFKTPAKSVVADVKSVLKVELVSLFVAAFLLGSAWGYIESFLFWLLEDLGGSKSLMGLTITVGGILGIPLLALSRYLIENFGHANIIFLGFLAYAVRLFGYSIIYNPWCSLIFEAMECLTQSLCFTAVVTYAARLSSVTTDTTVQGVIGGLFYGVGKSAGSLVGGYLIKFFGMRSTFQIFSAVTGITALLYLAFYHLYMKKRSALSYNNKDKAKDEDEHPKKPNSLADAKELNGIAKNSTQSKHPNDNLAFEDTELKHSSLNLPSPDKPASQLEKNEVV